MTHERSAEIAWWTVAERGKSLLVSVTMERKWEKKLLD
jgi:hypothetical protein